MKKNCKQMLIPPVACLVMLSPLNIVQAEEGVAVLDEVVVQSTSIKEYQVTTEVITAEQIKEMGATNVAEAINRVPGLYVSYVFKGATMARIRGAADDQTKIYIDGMPVFPMSGIASNYAANLGAIPVENIEKIEIIKGPGPVQYGTDYKGGMILITTKKGKGPQTNLRLSTGSHATFDNYISHSGSKDNFSYFITAGRQEGDGHLSNSEFKEDYFSGKLQWDVGNDSTLTLSGYSMNTDCEIPNGIDQATGMEMPSSISWSGDTKVGGKTNTKNWKHTDNKQTNLAVQFDQKVNNRFKYNVKAYHVRDDDHLWVYNGNNAALGTNTYANPIWYLSNWRSGGDGFEFTADWLAARNHTLTFGAKHTNIDWSSIENNSDAYSGGADKRYGYYLQDAISLNDKTKLTLGVRADRVNQSYHSSKTGSLTIDDGCKVNTTDPVLNITHQMDDNNRLRFSAGKTHMFVAAKEASANIRAGVPIPDTEKAKNYELGWAHSFDNTSSLDVAIFRNNIDNRITRRTTDQFDPLWGTYYNVGETEINGVEVAYRKNFSERLTGFINYTYQHAKDTDSTGVVKDSTNLPRTMVNYGLTYTVDKLQTTLSGSTRSKVLTGNTAYPYLDTYHTVDLYCRYNDNENTEYFLRINNLFNEQYWEKVTYPADEIKFLMGVNLKL